MPCFISFIICFGYNRVHFYAFSGTNLLTRCRSASCCFLLFLVSEILHGKYSRNRTGQKPNTLEVRGQHEDRRAPEDGHRGSLTTPRRGPPWPRLGMVGPPRVPTDVALAPIYSPDRENPKYPSQFSRKHPPQPSSSNPSRGVLEQSPGTLPEREIVTGGFFITMPASEVMHE